MVSIQTTQGLLEFSDEFVRTIERHASRHADHVDRFLIQSFGPRSGQISFRPTLLFELGAVLDLAYWETSGIGCLTRFGFPTYRQAREELADRCSNGPAEFEGANSSPLSVKLLQFLTEHLAWEGPEILQAELVIDEANEDQFIDLIAEFAWKYRHQLSQQIEGGNNEQEA